MRLMMGDCLERMGEIDSGSVDAIICDPPYGTVKNAPKNWTCGNDGAHEWDSAIDHDAMLGECNRILRPNGALLLFSQQPYTTKLISETHGNLPFSYCLTWLKNDFANALLCKKAPVNYTEDVCVFFKRHTKHDFEGFHPLRPYAAKVMQHIAKSRNEINADLGHRRAEHFFYIDSTQFNLCTAKTYAELFERYGIDRMDGFRTFDSLRIEDRAYRAELIEKMTREFPKVFNLPPDAKYKSNVLEYRKDYRGEHPTQKPVALMEDLVKTYTNEGDTVLDFTMGSGTTGVACANLGREFIGIERDDKYFAIAERRIQEAVDTKAGELF